MSFRNIFSRCPQCKAVFSLKKESENIVAREDIQILESLTQPTLKGELERMLDRYVPGDRIFYETVYVCRRCGAKCVRNSHKDIKK